MKLDIKPYNTSTYNAFIEINARFKNYKESQKYFN